ncbi:MAG: 2-amino-4-hydroxy-6-hydroxymethyldihydropteridine diphosphokinase [Dehalococcoidia bacterium]|nr:2-amino-4-hydroxy-6-hydroxymethyldihydropteridine diphosphokinase [Dehalococcoidia bacterium]MDZ4246327.1 2-amino-4-hydroxy-6-hydroxymethyldihydropteridine diphosphokinase [Dehalococcoidia bacterium]
MAEVYLSFGSNMGDRNKNLSTALSWLAKLTVVEKTSSIFETEPVEFLEQPKFLNMACKISTILGPLQLLSVIKGIEVKLGRRPAFRNAPRPIDIDILFFEDLIMDTAKLTLPHPALTERAFVLVPLAEISPDFSHPRGGKALSYYLNHVTGKEGVRRWTP